MSEPGGPVAPPPDAAARGVTYGVVNALALVVAGALAVASPALPLPARTAAPSTASLFLDATWSDGKAEVARYAATRTIYGRAERYELIQIVVKEPFDPATRTKPDAARAGVVDALKLVHVHDIGTKKEYRYRQTLVARVDRADPTRLLDASVTSMEWCGNTFALVTPRSGGFLRHVHSYFDGEGDREDALPAGTWLEDQLPVALRSIDLSTPREVPLLPTIVANRQPVTAPVATKIALEGDEDVQGRRCARVAVGASKWWIARDGERALVKVVHPDGRSMELKSIERLDYWVDPEKRAPR